ncbi:hypothetical protein A4G20_07655 [Pasteurellaceae bacterium RH1A]|nr:hypothetical protein A4G20_07655 [Pasteurellaceae bacterium RH1A]
MQSMSRVRIEGLDYLRGICAFLIMIYHYLLFNSNDVSVFGADLFITKVAIYGVSIFYILSGFTLYYVYQKYNFSKLKDIKFF